MTDTSAFDTKEPTGDLASLLAKAKELLETEKQIEGLGDLLKSLNSRANDLKTQIIPDEMAKVGLTEFKTPEGDKIKVEDFVAGSLPKDPVKRKTALDEVVKEGGEGIIKNEMLLTFEKSQHNEAMALADDLRQKGFNVEVTSGIHPQTYLAFVRERLKKGEEVNAEALGVFVGRKTKVELKR